MAQDSAPTNATPSTPVTTADVANASALVESVSVIRQALSSGSDAVVTAITAIATAVTQKLLGGVVGTTTNRLLKAKTVSSGSSAGSLQASGITCDDSNNLSGIAGVNANILIAAQGGSEGGEIHLAMPPSGSSLAADIAIDINTNSLRIFEIGGTNRGVNLNLVTQAAAGAGVSLATLNTNTWAQQQGFARVTLTDASTIAWNVQTQQSAYVLLTAAVGATRVLGAPSNMLAGFTYILMVQQAGTGGNAMTYNAVYKWPGGVAPTLSTGSFAIDILTFLSDGVSMYGVAQKAFA